MEGQEAQLCGNAAETQLVDDSGNKSDVAIGAMLFLSLPVILTDKEFLYRTAYLTVAMLGVFVRCALLLLPEG